jgi:Histidine kinase-, DNA gyrase B-, and HSP90-like ATPase
MTSTSLRPNLVKRIERLPKPTNVAGAMQPLFEAISNSIHSTQANFGENARQKGRITVTISTDRKKEDVWAVVEDNGVGLDEANWEAFTTTDTDNKMQIGGKGVGRLLWLDCFQDIEIESIFKSGRFLKKRSFKFVLAAKDQIRDEKIAGTPLGSSTSFRAKFSGLRDNGYPYQDEKEFRIKYTPTAIASLNQGNSKLIWARSKESL